VELRSEDRLSAHIRKMHIHVCPQCGGEFQNKGEFDQHFQNDHKVACPHCEKVLQNQEKLDHHIYMNHTHQTCEKCDIKFPSRKAYRTHNLQEHPIVKGEFYVPLKVLKGGNRGLKPRKCPKCGMEFFSNKDLRFHKREEHGIRCNLCDFIALSRKSLENHITKKHSPKTCTTCLLTFKDEISLKNHIRKGHGLDCPHCSARLIDDRRLRRHIRRSHPEIYNTKKQTPKKSQKVEKPKQLIECDICSVKLSPKAFYNHIDSCREKSLKSLIKTSLTKNITQTYIQVRVDPKTKEEYIYCDLHGLFLDESKKEIKQAFKKCQENGSDRVEIIHGHVHGQVLKNYIRSKKFIKDMHFRQFDVRIFDKSDPGATTIKIL